MNRARASRRVRSLLLCAAFALPRFAAAQLPQPTQPPPTSAAQTTPTAPSSTSTVGAGSAIEAIGQAPIVNGDRVRARERALDEAFRSAIDVAAQSLPPSPGAGNRNSILKLSVHPKAKSYIAGYRILEEGEQATTFRVHVAAEVAFDRLERDLSRGGNAPGGANASGGNNSGDGKAGARTQVPKMLVCLAEKHLSGSGSWINSAPIAAWTISADPAPKNALAATGIEIAAMTIACVPDGDSDVPTDEKARQELRASGASAALVGTLLVSPAGYIRGTTLVAAHAIATFDLVDADGAEHSTARVEHDAFGESAATAEHEAAGAALGEALAKIGPAVARKQSSMVAGPGVLVHLVGVKTWADLQLFQRSATVIPGVLTVEPRRFSSDGIDFYVRGSLAAPGLATALSHTPDAARLLVLPEGDRVLQARIVPPTALDGGGAGDGTLPHLPPAAIPGAAPGVIR